ncbi:phosphatase PAP2 family protein [Psychrobacter sp. FDAARGOS_221]|uniref:phosphatase PAP2 family protein n=1 Tax=Psychrobacter sp. FDAARGOS_221 TaxID=1975705 RepID=UPI000FDC1FE8|nr:phosphatase PAP2 family protein [Psychrobacter sp. FDAARGOS_221]
MINLALSIDSHIPFISAMIVPYSWSILLFCTGFFLVNTQHQLSMLTRRLVLSTLFACFVFYLFPARFSFNRPETIGWLGYGYDFLAITDKPYNQFPSLHVAYALLIGGSLYPIVKRTTTKILLLLICGLIIISTVFTYQHHLLDVLGGFVLAALVWQLAGRMRSHLVLKYITVAISGFLIIAITAYLLAYDSSNFWINLALIVAVYWLISFLTLAWAYQYPSISRNRLWFTKTLSGQHRFWVWLAFSPLISTYYLMWRLRFLLSKSATSSLNQIPLYWITHTKSESFKPTKLSQTYTVATARLPCSVTIEPNKPVKTLIVIDLAAEISSHYGYLEKDQLEQDQTSHTYIYFPILDLQPLSDIALTEFISLFEKIDACIEQNINNNTPTIIHFHCVMGMSRSVAIQILYLLYCGQLTVDNYKQWLDEYYPNAHVNETYLSYDLIQKISNYSSNHSTMN